MTDMETLHVDCAGCRVRGAACNDCVVSVLLGPVEDGSLTATEQSAVGVLASRGLIPPLRLARTLSDTRDELSQIV